MGAPLLGAGIGAAGAAVLMPHAHPDYGGFDEHRVGQMLPDALLEASPGTRAVPATNLSYYVIPALLGGVTGVSMTQGMALGERAVVTLGTSAGAATLAYIVRPQPLPAAYTTNLIIARDAIIEAEADTFKNAVAVAIMGPLTYWSATRINHPFLALALAGGAVAMIYSNAKNIIDTRVLRRRFEQAAARADLTRPVKPPAAPVAGLHRRRRRITLGATDDVDGVSKVSQVLAALERAAKPTVFAAIAKVDTTAEREIRNTVKDAPSFLLDTITDTAFKAAEKMGDGKAAAALADVRARGRAENATEAREGLDAVTRILASSHAARDLTDRAIEVLERQGILGRGVLSDLVSLLVSVGAAGAGQVLVKRATSGGEVSLVTPGASFSITKMGDYSTKLRLRNPAWAGNAVTVALTGSTMTASRARQLDPVSRQLEPARGVESLELAAPIPIGVRTRTGTTPVVLTPYYSTSVVTKAQEGGVRAGFKF
jgi:hypothetical protein